MKLIFCLFSLFHIVLATFDVASYTSSQILTITGTTTGNNFQFPISNAGDVNHDGKDDIIIGGYGTDDSGQKESAYIVYGQSSFNAVNLDFVNFAVSSTSAGIAITGTHGSDGFGSAVSGAGDINNDGIDDFMIGAFRKNAHQGRVYVVYGKSDLQNMNVLTPGLDPTKDGFFIQGNVDENYLGYSISKAGDINGDGIDDIVIGIHGKNTNRGAAAVIYGGTTSTLSNVNVTDATATVSPSTAGFSMLGKAAYGIFGCSVSNAGDVNNDGRDDILVGAPGNSSHRGAAYVIYGSQSPVNIDLSSKDLDPTTTGFSILAKTTGDFFGVSVSAAGDVNGDGIDDIIIGANSTDSGTGAAYVIYGSKNPVDIDLSDYTLAAASTGFVVKGTAANDQLGFSVKTVGDLNSDGFSDVVIGAPNQGGTGAVHVIYGGKSLLDVFDLSETSLDPLTTGFSFVRSSVTSGNFGWTISSGDFDEDGKSELFVGTFAKSNPANVGYVIGLSSK